MRAIPLHPLLAEELDAWNLFVNPTNSESWVFPGRHPGEHLTRRFFDHALRKAVDELWSRELQLTPPDEAF